MIRLSVDFIERWLGSLTGPVFIFLAIFLCVLVVGVFRDRWLNNNRAGSGYLTGRGGSGTRLGVTLIILMAALAVLATGLSAPQVMIGDEVTHYYMLTSQAEMLPQPNFFSHIPSGWGDVEIRRYPHSFFWHYLGGIIFLLTGGSFAAIQVYQALFFVQFLVAGYLLAQGRHGVESRSALLFVLVLASLPMALIFSVAFYQDIPMTAQVVTAFVFLDRRRWLPATLFICLAMALKVNAFIFMPAFLLVLFVRSLQWYGVRKAMSISLCSLFIIACSTWMLGKAINVYAGSSFYPVEKAEKIIKKVTGFKRADSQAELQKKQAVQKIMKKRGAKAPIIANHPGDLRIPANYLIYGGLVFWLVCLAWLIQQLWQRFFAGNGMEEGGGTGPTWWLFFVGGWYTLVTVFLVRTAPDARFFLPGLPFLLLPLVEKTVRLPQPKVILSLFASLAIMQSGYVLAKTYSLRQVFPELKEAISYLADNPPAPARIFMYPEGNYRLFPVPHEWYLGYHLRDFWRADNTTRINMLQRYKIGAVVIKKHLVAPVDKEITNLGVYPDYFVQDIKKDSRFQKVFGNSRVVIYSIAAEK